MTEKANINGLREKTKRPKEDSVKEETKAGVDNVKSLGRKPWRKRHGYCDRKCVMLCKYTKWNNTDSDDDDCYSFVKIQDPGFPVGGVNLVGGRRLPRPLRFENFVRRNERIWTLSGLGVRRDTVDKWLQPRRDQYFK